MPEKPKKAVPKKPAPAARAAAPKAAAPSRQEMKAKTDQENAAKLRKEAEKLGMVVVNWEPERLSKFLGGNLTLASLENMPTKQLYDMADVGYRLMTQGKFDDAEKIFAGLAVMDPYDAYFQLVLGSIYQRKNDLQKAERHYSRAIDINTGFSAAYANRGEVRILLQKFGDAISDFSSAIRLDPDSKDPAAMRARVMLLAISSKVKEARTQKGQSA